MILSRVLPTSCEEADYERVPTANAIVLTPTTSDTNNTNTSTTNQNNPTTTIIAEPFHGTVALPIPANDPFHILNAVPTDSGSTYVLPFFRPRTTQQVSYAQPITAQLQINRSYPTRRVDPSHDRHPRWNSYKYHFQNLPIVMRVFIYIMSSCCAFCICLLLISVIIAVEIGELTQSSGYFHTVYYLDPSCSSLALYQMGVPTDTCFPYYSTNSGLSSNTSAAYLYYETNTTFVVYSERNCEGEIVSSQSSQYYGCSPVANVENLYQSSFYYANGYHYVLSTFSFDNLGYSQNGCNSPTETMSIALDTCIPTPMASSVIYTLIDDEGGLHKRVYLGNSNCSRVNDLTTINPGCNFVNQLPSIAPYRTYSITDQCT